MSPVIRSKKKKLDISPNMLLVILSVFSVLLMVVTYFTGIFDGPLRTAAGYVVVPFENGIASVGGYLYDRSKTLEQLKDVQAENEELKSQLDELSMENAQLMQDKYELTKLRELYSIDQLLSDYRKVGARVIASDSGNWFYSFIIDKGTQDGLQVDMNVIAGGGLVGRISAVGDNYARVQAIIDDKANVYATVLSIDENLVVNGNLQSMLTQGVIGFEQLADPENRVSAGDKVVTSTISSKYLSGIPIGYISQVNVSANNLTKTGTLTPYVDFRHLSEVLVILDQKQVPEEEE